MSEIDQPPPKTKGRGQGWKRSPLTQIVNCAYCRKPFDRRPSHTCQSHCSKECRAANKGRPSNVKPLPLRYYICQNCGKEFSTKFTRPRKYCSHQCDGERYRLPYRQCLHCHIKFRPRHAPQVYCCNDCKFSEQEPRLPTFFEKIRKQHRTDIEAIMEQCLKELGVAYKWEQRFGKYWVDFYLPA